MNLEESDFELARAIARILARPATVTSEIEHFAESSFGIRSQRELVEVLTRGDPDDRTQILELLIFPDESTQAELEPLLEKLTPAEDLQYRLVALLKTQAPRLNLRFPESEGTFSLILPTPVLASYVSRLYPDRCLDPQTLTCIDATFSPGQGNRVKTAIRNHDLPAVSAPWSLLRRFLGVMKSVRGDGMACLSRLLNILEQSPAPGDYYPSLSKLKHLYSRELRRWEQFERLHARLPMESLLLQGIQPPAMTREALLNELAYIDQLAMLLYGKVEGIESPQLLSHPAGPQGGSGKIEQRPSGVCKGRNWI